MESLLERSLPVRSEYFIPAIVCSTPAEKYATSRTGMVIVRIVSEGNLASSFPLVQWIRAVQRDYHVTRFRR